MVPDLRELNSDRSLNSRSQKIQARKHFTSVITCEIPFMLNSPNSSSDGSNYVRSSMIDRSKAKIGCSSSISNR